jgi:hypothetical protein
MTKPYQLTCYLCEKTEQFDELEDAKASDWEKISQTGVIKEEYYEHSAYCEGHALGQ